MRDRGSTHPMNGGCWFCWNNDGDLVLDKEFDTYIHLDCLKEVFKENPHHPEAQFMGYLLDNGE